MTVDLMTLAKKADEIYRDVNTSFSTLRIYNVPDLMLLSQSPDRPKPELPIVRMKTVTGYQDRAAKPGDPEYIQYQKDQTAYSDEEFELSVAIGVVYALKDIDWSQYDLSAPPPIEDAQKMYNGKWPAHDLLRKKAWLDWTIFYTRKDRDIILAASNEMRGETEPTDEMVEAVKKNSDSSSEPSRVE
jgi:hypothetical protein